jgi:hypothetical protein
VEAYFKFFYPLFQITDAQYFLGRYKKNGVQQINLLLLWSIFSVSASYISEPRSIERSKDPQIVQRRHHHASKISLWSQQRERQDNPHSIVPSSSVSGSRTQRAQSKVGIGLVSLPTLRRPLALIETRMGKGREGMRRLVRDREGCGGTFGGAVS